MKHAPDQELFLIELLIRSYSWFVKELNAGLEASDGVPLTRAQIITLFYLEDGTDRVQTLSTRMGLSRQAVSLTLKELRQNGVLEMRVDPTSRNAKIINMTPMGRRSVAEAFGVLRGLESRLADKLGDEALRDAKAFLAADWD